jgi:3-hydroxyisobutyrate dehydrogenase
MNVAFLGLGAIGYPMAGHVKKQFETLVWNRTASVAERHSGEHGTRAASITECAAADVVISCVPTSREVREIVDAVSGSLRPGTLWIDCTSGDPATTREIAATLAASGVEFVDAPVTGGKLGAEAGKLTIMVGGSDENFQRAQVVLETFAAKIVHVGDVGFGMAIKAMNNAMLAANMWVAAECMVSLRKMGFDLARAFEVINAGSGRSFVTESLLPMRLVEGEWPIWFKLAMLDKDVRIAVETMHGQHLASPVVGLVSNLYTAARKELGEDADYVEICRFVAGMNGESW